MPLADREFQELLVKLSPTIIGVKPAELINIKFGALEKCRRYFGPFTDFKYMEIRDFTRLGRKQLFFYHRQCLMEVLNNEENKKFLIKLGYPSAFDINHYLAILAKKLQSNSFPHEIGIFLGYPLKDVLGYMGLSSQKVIKVKGWRYYGDESLSLLQYNKFLKARDVFKVFLDNLTQAMTGNSK
ncbi:MAG: DUF3793 family protein [Clostridia bacterium]|nr:DUF3793 family protein [Clostridia bacterium]